MLQSDAQDSGGGSSCAQPAGPTEQGEQLLGEALHDLHG